MAESNINNGAFEGDQTASSTWQTFNEAKQDFNYLESTKATVEEAIAAANGVIWKATLAEVNAIDPLVIDTAYGVYNDGDNNGYYYWDGASATVTFNRDLGVEKTNDINDTSGKVITAEAVKDRFSVFGTILKQSSVRIDNTTDEITIVPTFRVTNGLKTYNINAATTLVIPSGASMLYLEEDGTLGMVSDVNLVPDKAIVFSTIERITSQGEYRMSNGIDFEVNQRKIDENTNGILNNYASQVSFNTSDNTLTINGAYGVVGNKSILISGQTISIVTSGFRKVVFSNDGVLRALPLNTDIRFDEHVLFTYIRNTSTSVVVSGIDNYEVNGVDNKTLAAPIVQKIGFYVGTQFDVNVNRALIDFSGGYVFFDGARYLVSSQTFGDGVSSSPSVLYYDTADGLIKAERTGSSMSFPDTAIVIGGHAGIATYGHLQLYGFDNYTVAGKPYEYLKQQISKKILVDHFVNGYYSSDSTLSMTNSDPVPIETSSPNYIINLWENLIDQYPDDFTKENLTTIEKDGTNYPLNIYTFNPPTVTEDFFSETVDNVLPHVFVINAIHGYEKINPLATFYFIKDVIEKRDTCEVCGWFYYNIKISVSPMTNPTGWVDDTRNNDNGVDLNRNWDYKFAVANEGTSQYSGAAAFDQPETAALKTWLENNDVHGGIDFHNYVATFENRGVLWTLGTDKLGGNVGRAAIQHISRNIKSSNPLFPQGARDIVGESSYVVNTRGFAGGWMNYKLGFGMTFECSSTFPYDPNLVEYDANAIRVSIEVFGNFLRTFCQEMIKDYNTKNNIY